MAGIGGRVKKQLVAIGKQQRACIADNIPEAADETCARAIFQFFDLPVFVDQTGPVQARWCFDRNAPDWLRKAGGCRSASLCPTVHLRVNCGRERSPVAIATRPNIAGIY
jgi:hypothetical protein